MSSKLSNASYETMFQVFTQIYSTEGTEDVKCAKFGDYLLEFSVDQLKKALVVGRETLLNQPILKERVCKEFPTWAEGLATRAMNIALQGLTIKCIEICLKSKIEIEDVQTFCDYFQNGNLALALEVIKKMEAAGNPHAERARQIYNENNIAK